MRASLLILAAILNVQPVRGQALTLSLRDVLTRAAQYSNQVQTADIAAKLAHEDTSQAKAATLPSVDALNQFIYTEGNRTPSGVFVANDGVHIYNEQAVVHEEVLSLIRRGEIRQAAAAEAVAKAKTDIATRGLRSTLVADYYTVISATRRLENANKSLGEAQQFFDITQAQEKGGEAAHADVIKAQISLQQRQRDVQDAQLGVQRAKITLAVLIFPSLRLDYDLIDDLESIPVLPPAADATAQAKATSPDLAAARSTVNQSRSGLSVARYGYLPALTLNFYYGIDANQFAARTNYPTESSGHEGLPNYLVPYRQNLGYSAEATLTVPIWNWGAIRSRVKQAGLREKQAQLDLSVTQRQVQADISSTYAEAQTAFLQIPSLRSSSDLSAESLRLTLLRYKAGEATALEVVDAQTTALQARAAYNDGLVRYRTAFETLQTLTGNY